MFDKIISLNDCKEKYRENFALISGGNTTNISDSVKVKKSYENNQKIDRSMVVNSLTKLINNIANDVVQKNASNAAAAVGASNTVFLSGITCDTVTISGIRQQSQSDLSIQVKSQQSNASKVSNEIKTNIDKTISKVGNTDLAKLQAANTQQLNDYMNAMPGYDPDKAQKLASQCPSDSGSLISAGNTCNVSTSYELDGTVKQKLELDESFKINDNDDVSNDIKTKIEQANFATCQSNASADNSIVIQDIMCGVAEAASKAERKAKKGGSFEFSDIDQKAVANLYMTCVFDQKNISEIANKIENRIAKRYNQIYDEVERKAKTMGSKGAAYYDKATDFVDTFAGAGLEKIMAAAGDLPEKTADSGKSIEKTVENKFEKSGDDTVSDKFPEPHNNNNIKPISQLEPIKPISQLEPIKPQPIKKDTVPEETTAQQAQPAQPEAQSAQMDVLTKLSKLNETDPWIIYSGLSLIILIIFVIIILIFGGSSKSNNSNSDSDN